jgi:ATP-binding cassette subfamily B multidrug efflux pump
MMKYIRQMFKFLKPYKKAAIIAPLLIIIEVIADLMLPTLMVNVINVGIANNDFNYIVIRLAIMLCVTLIGAISAAGSTSFAAKFNRY